MVSVVLHRFRFVPQQLSTFTSRSPSPVTTSPPRLRFSVSSSSSPSPLDTQIEKRPRFMEFPHLSVVHRNLMEEIFSAIEGKLGSQLLPHTLPPDVQFFQNQSGTSQGSLYIRTGNEFSSVDVLLGSWLHCELPSGALDIASLSAYLNLSTVAPHFVLEFIKSSPTSLVLLLDLLPRKDLVLHQDYLETFYSNTQLERWRQELRKLPEVQPYFLSSLRLRPLFSPTANLIRIDCSCEEEGEAVGQSRMDEIIHDHIGPIAKEVLGIWLDHCACRVGGREVGESEQALLGKRDHVIKDTAVKVDLISNFPRLFGPDVASRVISAIQGIFDI